MEWRRTEDQIYQLWWHCLLPPSGFCEKKKWNFSVSHVSKIPRKTFHSQLWLQAHHRYSCGVSGIYHDLLHLWRTFTYCLSSSPCWITKQLSGCRVLWGDGIAPAALPAKLTGASVAKAELCWAVGKSSGLLQWSHSVPSFKGSDGKPQISPLGL